MTGGRGRFVGGLAVASLLAVGARAQGQDTTRAAVRPDTDTVAVRTLPVNGMLIRPQHLTYRMSVLGPDSTHVVGTRDVNVVSSTYGGFPAWLIVQARGGHVATIDSLFLSAVDVRPLHWSSTIGPARLALEFTADSVYGGTSGPSGSQTIILPHGRDLLAGSGMTELVLQLMPHAVGRVDSVSVMQVDLGSAQILPSALSVDGEQDIDTPLGRMHCWRITLTTPVGSMRYWVSESNPVVVRTQQTLPGHPAASFEQLLVARQ